MNWFLLAMQAITQIPNLIAHLKATSSDPGLTKQAKVLDIVTSSVGELDSLAPSVMAHPQVQAALKTANDAIYYAGQVIAAVGAQNALPPVQTLTAAAPPVA